MKKYNIIYADPPFPNTDKAVAGKRGAGFKYSQMSIKEICDLPVQNMTTDDAVLFIWIPPIFVIEGLTKVIPAWGFKYKTKGFVWIKVSKAGLPLMGMGHYTRANSEDCYLAVKGRLPVFSHGVRQVVLAPRREHSRKPEEVRDGIVELYGKYPRIELFAREKPKGWSVWGDEAPGSIDIERYRK